MTISTASASAHPRTALSVNVNKVALVRNTRHLGIPSVLRAAEHVGYHSQAAFTRAFKKVIGEQPGAFQRARRSALHL